jgi:hypothetical protein
MKFRGHLEDQRVDGSIKFNLKEIEWEDEEWIQLAQDIKQWRTLVTTVINI